MRNTRVAVIPAALLSVSLVAGCGPSSTKSAASKAAGGASAAASNAGSNASAGASSAAGGSSAGASAGSSDSATSCPTDGNTKNFAKTRFVTDLGLAAGTFHRYLWKPYQAGTFKKGANGRIMAIAKGAGAAAVDVHLLKNAASNAKANPTLCKSVAKPLSDAASKLGDIKGNLMSGNFGNLAAAESSIQSALTGSKSAGDEVKENDNLSQAQSAVSGK